MGETRRLRDIAEPLRLRSAGHRRLLSMLERQEVDSKRVAIMGYSFGSYSLSRIAAL